MLYVKCFIFNPVQENTYVLYDETGDAAIVDCGCMDESEQDQLKAFITEKQLKPSLLLNTHLHFDHVWGNAWAMRTWDLTAYCHEADLAMPIKPSDQLRLFGINSPLENLPKESYHVLKQGDLLKIGNSQIEVRHVPGHSPGHIVFCHIEEGNNLVISGDTLFRENIGRTDLWGGNYDQLISAIKTQLFTLPQETEVYPGHGDITQIGYEIDNNPYF